jgi:predicted DNA-binding transcriptional regulator YafY
MAFSDAKQLLDLAAMAAARSYVGVTLNDIEDRFEVSHRTAQRMAQALVEIFPETEVVENPDRRRAWRLPSGDVRHLRGIGDDELAALDLAIRVAEHACDVGMARALSRLSQRLRAAAPRGDILRAEADAEALLEASEFAARAGPRSRVSPEVAEAVALALKGPSLLRMRYRGRDGVTERVVEPHGLLMGARRYLVARQPERGPAMRHWRLDRIEDAAALSESFVRDADFDMRVHAARAFGAFQSDEEYGEVVWKFAPEAADVAREFEFHPRQRTELTENGSLIVRFEAAGWTEMAWHLYQWGDRVEVLAPEALRRMVKGHRRSDLALP